MKRLTDEAPRLGDELSQDAMGETAKTAFSAAQALQTDGLGSDFDRFTDLWKLLNFDDRAALLAQAERLAESHGG